MRKKILALSALLLVNIVLVIAVSFVLTRPPDFARMQAPAFLIQVGVINLASKDSAVMKGSGTAIAERQRPDGTWEIDILTNRHIIEVDEEKSKKGWVLSGTVLVTWWHYPDDPKAPLIGFTREARIIRVSERYDLALIQMESPVPLHIAPIAKMPVKEGAAVCAVGSPESLPAVVTCDRVSIRRHMYTQLAYLGERYRDIYLVMATAPIWSGNSGGALYNDRYELVGVSVLVGGTAHLAYFVPLEEVREFLGIAEKN